MTRYAKMPRPFLLGQIIVLLNMTAQRLTIQLMGALRTRTLAIQAAGLDPAVNARLPNLESARCLRFASTARYKRDDALA